MEKNYDLIVIGGGAAGLVAATGGAALGVKTAMIEKKRLGGDCTWYGCVPSKALLKAAQAYRYTQRLSEYGIVAGDGNTYDTSKVMDHVRSLVAEVATHHPAEVFEKRGIDVLFGPPRFTDKNTVVLNGDTLRAKRFILATGSHPMVPPVEGLDGVSYLTNESVFDLKKLPQSLIVLGGGPIGVELAQAFGRLGVTVSLVEMADRILFREEKEIGAVLSERLTHEGVALYTGRKAVMFAQKAAMITVTLEDANKHRQDIQAEQVLVAVGRAPNITDLDLEKAGVRYSNKGVAVDGFLRTTNPAIYAAGDIAGPYQFSHMAEYHGIVSVGNALFPFKQKVNYRTVPWCTFTDPEVAHLGLTEEEARAQYGSDVRVYRSPYSANDRAVTDLETSGLAKVICDKKGRILGAHIAGVNAGEIIHEYVLAQAHKLAIGKLSSPIHIYPTLAQIVKRSGDQKVTEVLSAGWFKLLTRVLLKFLR